MFCYNCGNNLPDGTNFCGRCGANQNPGSAPALNVIPCENPVIYDIEGVRGKHITVYSNKCVINTRPTFGSFLAQNMTDGEKTIYYRDCIGVQFKRSGFAIGYIQIETAASMMNNKNSNFFGENSFTFDTTKVSNEFMEQVAAYIKKRVEDIKEGKDVPASNTSPVYAPSPADELKKYKELLDNGILTQEEFELKKKQILGI